MITERELLWLKGCSFEIIAEFLGTSVSNEKMIFAQHLRREFEL